MSEPTGNTAGPSGDNNSPFDTIKDIQLRQEFVRLTQLAIHLDKVARNVESECQHVRRERNKLNKDLDARSELANQIDRNDKALKQYLDQHQQDAGQSQPLPERLEQAIPKHKQSISDLKQITTKHFSAINAINHNSKNLREASDKLERDMKKLQQHTDQFFKRVRDECGMDLRMFDRIIGDEVRFIGERVKNVVTMYWEAKNGKLPVELWHMPNKQSDD